jgi:hypothetical protein
MNYEEVHAYFNSVDNFDSPNKIENNPLNDSKSNLFHDRKRKLPSLVKDSTEI